MQTSPRKISRRRGFTFIEIMAALVIMTLVMVVALPAFNAMFEGERQRELNRLVATLRSLCTEAVLTREPFRLEFDLPGNRYLPQRREDSGRFMPFPAGSDFAAHEFPESLRIADIVPYGATGGPITARPVTIAIDASGFIDPFLLHIREGKDDWTLRVEFICRPELVAGYSNVLLE